MELIVGHYQKNYRTVKFTLRSRSKHLPLVKTLQNGIKESDREGFGRIGSREREREREGGERKKSCVCFDENRPSEQTIEQRRKNKNGKAKMEERKKKKKEKEGKEREGGRKKMQKKEGKKKKERAENINA